LAYLVTGRRNSEIRKLQYGDFEFDCEAVISSEAVRRIYYRWTGKGRSRRDECPSIVWESIQDFLCAADKLESIQPDDYIFTPLTDRAARLPNVDPARWTRNRPLSSREVGRLLKKYARRAGLDPSKIRVHTLRHTAAMLRKQAGDDIDQISTFLGHSSLSTTQIYLHRLSGQSDSSWLRVAELLGL
jgi:integrase